MLERLAACGADGLLSDWEGRTPLEVTEEGEEKGLESRREWRRMYREVFQIPQPVESNDVEAGGAAGP